MVFNFFSPRVDTEKIPRCPRCKRVSLKRQMSVFSNLSKGKTKSGEDGEMTMDEARMEKAMAMLAGEVGNLDENDPRQAAKLMRKLSEATEMNMGDAMEEMLARMEKGEDPDEIEAQMGAMCWKTPIPSSRNRRKNTPAGWKSRGLMRPFTICNSKRMVTRCLPVLPWFVKS